eukprot:12420192-Karenia_brevis.AAC.1
MPQDHPAFDHLQLTADVSDTVDAECRQELPRHLDQTWTQELVSTGRIVIYTDGASTRNQDVRLRKAGVGVFWGRDHPKNMAFPLEGLRQTNQRAELMAVKAALTHEARPCEIRSDSEYVVKGCTKHLNKWRKENFLEGDHDDLWRDISNILLARPADSVLFTWVTGHATWIDVKSGRVARENKLGNDFADFLARSGAARHPPNLLLQASVENTRFLTVQVQTMMVKIVQARNSKSKCITETLDLDAQGYVLSATDLDDCIDVSSPSDDCVELLEVDDTDSEPEIVNVSCAEDRPLFHGYNVASGRGAPRAPI